MAVSLQPSLTIATLLKREVRPVVLLGAGASARSGIPLTDELVAEIAKWGFCKAHARDLNDPTLMRSDWWPWLVKQRWFRHDAPLSEHYPRAVEAVLQPREDRKNFFQRVLNPGVRVSRGYDVLAELLARGVLRHTLTTNFDSLLATQCRSLASVYEIIEIKTPDDFRRFSVSPQYPQIVYLHGSVEHYTDQNVEQETQKLNSTLTELLSPVLRDHPLVVIGYRGAEPSVMRHLLIDQAAQYREFRHGIYWCQRGDREPEKGSLLAELAGVAGSNFQFVGIDGFDEIMDEIRVALPEILAATGGAVTLRSRPSRASDSQVHDLSAADVTLESLDEALMRAKILAYCEAVRLPRPPLRSSADLVALMRNRSLAMPGDENCIPTCGAQLLFAREPRVQLEHALIEINLEGNSSWLDEILERPSGASPSVAPEPSIERLTIDGNLWVQLDVASNLLSRVNRPFRLKGATSLDVYPYPPLALKEVLTNLLAHRDYNANRVSTILITPTDIKFSNPGGLTDHVRAQLHARALQSAIEESARGIKGYRNPVVADFFFSAGAMEKEGSGLPDVVSEAANNLNVVEFGPTSDNQDFVVVIHARPEAAHIDPATRTARPLQGELRYSPNLLPVQRWPENVSKLGTVATRGEFAVAREAGAPPFCLMRDWIWTFDELNSLESQPLKALGLAEEQYTVPSVDLLGDESASWILPHLLNSALEAHLCRLGLQVRFEGRQVRAYFASDDGAPREITYRGMFKQATRTVAKPIVSRSTGKATFWEHKAVGLRFERFGADWSLAILPGYVFTLDGANTPIASERIGPLTTRRAARDYNPTVLHDLVFWSRVIAGGASSTFRMGLGAKNAALTDKTPTLELSALISTVVFAEPPEDAQASSLPTEMTETEILELQAEIEKIVAEGEEAINEP